MMKLAQDCKFRLLIKAKIATGHFMKKCGDWKQISTHSYLSFNALHMGASPAYNSCFHISALKIKFREFMESEILQECAGRI